MEKHKVNLDRPNISSEEIKAKQNFDQIIKNYHVTPKSFLQKGWFWGTVGLASVAAITVFSFTSIKSADAEKENKVVQTTDSSQLPPDTPCIKAPVEGKEQKFQSFKIDPSQDNKITTDAGSVINIPANSFKDEKGNLVTNQIDIQIREFYDKEDVFLSGIPMAYDSANTQYSLETAGMIEIRSFNENLEIKNLENEMTIDLATNNSDDNFNLYYLNEDKKNWEFEKPLKINNDQIDENLEAPSVYEEKCEDLEKKIKIVNSEISKIQKTKPLEPRKVNPKNFTFDIDANKRHFPELASFKNVIFEVGAENKGFSDKVYEQTWEDVKLSKSGDKYKIQLVKGSHVESYIVYPALQGAEYNKAKAEFDQKFNSYSKVLNEKKVEKQNFEEEYQYNKRKWQKAVEIAERVEYKEKAKVAPAPNVKYSEINKKQSNISRLFRTRRTGVFNCDRPLKYPTQSKIMASFQREDGSKIKNLHNVNLVTEKQNTLFRYDRNRLNQFGYNANHMNRIWLVDEEGDIYACGNEEFNKINKKEGMHIFTMKKVPEFETIEEFRILTMSAEAIES